MTFIHNFDNKIRFLVIYQDVSKKPTVIQKHTGIQLGTIYSWIQKTEQDINILERAKGQGRKEKIPSNVKNNIVRTTRRNPHSSSTRTLSRKYNVGTSTVERTLTEKNFKYKKPKVYKKLNSAEKQNRVDFSQDMINARGKRVMSTFFSDETGIDLSEAYSDKVWNPPRKQVKVDYPKKDVRLNCWGAISAKGATSLHIYKGTLDTDRYIKILQEHKEEMDRTVSKRVQFSER
jgi:transposase